MKVLVIGGTGTVGKAVVKSLKDNHEVVVAGFSGGDVQVDIADLKSVQQMYKKVSSLDAVVMTTGKVTFKALGKMTETDYQFGLNNKLMGQVNVVLEGLKHLNDGGSFTLTSGILNHDPIKLGSSAAMVNGGVDSFVKASSMEMPRGLRINVVSPTVLTEALEAYGPYFPGYESVSASKVALAYQKSVDGVQTGQVYRVGWNT